MGSKQRFIKVSSWSGLVESVLTHEVGIVSNKDQNVLRTEIPQALSLARFRVSKKKVSVYPSWRAFTTC